MHLVNRPLLFFSCFDDLGRPIALHGVTAEKIASNRIEIDAARLMVMQAALSIDLYGAKGAKYI